MTLSMAINKHNTYAECQNYVNYAECHSPECHYAECCYAECRYADCHYAECHYAECRYAECHYAECHSAECRYAECRGAMKRRHLLLVYKLLGEKGHSFDKAKTFFVVVVAILLHTNYNVDNLDVGSLISQIFAQW